MKKLKIFAPVLLMLLISCNSTKVTSSWQADDAVNNTFNKIIVYGIFNQKNRVMRQTIENKIVAQLNSIGYNAVSALAMYGPKAFAKVKEDDIADELKSSGFDAVLTTTLLDKTSQRNYTPGNVTYSPVGLVRFGRYYSTVYDRVYQPGYYTHSTNFYLESNLYGLRTSDLKYSVQSSSFDPSSFTSLANDYSKKIIKDMLKKNILKKKT
ncbi:MAG: hypothetical protein JSU03_09605 [Bacteroidetes bacterium]|nr:hypothetical protein [Bacteroidota bacterium]MBS1757521.1 hypothetical protein [Bacteroidota bacterium]